MKASDIVQREIERQIDFGYEPSYEDMVIAGYQAGIKEVVEWLERCKKIRLPKYQLKEWGLE